MSKKTLIIIGSLIIFMSVGIGIMLFVYKNLHQQEATLINNTVNYTKKQEKSVIEKQMEELNKLRAEALKNNPSLTSTSTLEKQMKELDVMRAEALKKTPEVVSTSTIEKQMLELNKMRAESMASSSIKQPHLK